MDLHRCLSREGTLAGTWLIFVSVYALLVFQFLKPAPWAETQYRLWQATSYLAELLAVIVFVVAVGLLWYGRPSMLGKLLAGLALAYVPLHIVMSRGLFVGSELYLQLTHLRQPFYPVLTILALVVVIRTLAYKGPDSRQAGMRG